jgi:hypothetical protein
VCDHTHEIIWSDCDLLHMGEADGIGCSSTSGSSGQHQQQTRDEENCNTSSSSGCRAQGLGAVGKIRRTQSIHLHVCTSHTRQEPGQ